MIEELILFLATITLMFCLFFVIYKSIISEIERVLENTNKLIDNIISKQFPSDYEISYEDDSTLIVKDKSSNEKFEIVINEIND